MPDESLFPLPWLYSGVPAWFVHQVSGNPGLNHTNRQALCVIGFFVLFFYPLFLCFQDYFLIILDWKLHLPRDQAESFVGLFSLACGCLSVCLRFLPSFCLFSPVPRLQRLLTARLMEERMISGSAARGLQISGCTERWEASRCLATVRGGGCGGKRGLSQESISCFYL